MLWTTPSFAFGCRRSCADAGKNSLRAKFGLDSPPPPIIQNSMVNTVLRGDSGVLIRGKISKAAIAAVAAVSTFGVCSPLSGQERREPSTVVVYGDASRDWMAEVQRFSGFIAVKGSFTQDPSFPSGVTEPYCLTCR
jgi:hypothetical protein